MNIIYVLIPLALLLLVAAVAAFLWAVRNAQFDDLDSPATRILFDDDEPVPAPPTAPAQEAARDVAREAAREAE